MTLNNLMVRSNNTWALGNVEYPFITGAVEYTDWFSAEG